MIDDPFKNLPYIFGDNMQNNMARTASQVEIQQRQQEIHLRNLLEKRVNSLFIQTDIRTSVGRTVIESQMLDNETGVRNVKTFSHEFKDLMEKSIMYSGSPELKITIKELEELLVIAKHTLITRLISN